MIIYYIIRYGNKTAKELFLCKIGWEKVLNILKSWSEKLWSNTKSIENIENIHINAWWNNQVVNVWNGV